MLVIVKYFLLIRMVSAVTNLTLLVPHAQAMLMWNKAMKVT